MEQELHQFLFALGDVQKGLELYSRGRREEGENILGKCLKKLRGVVQGPQWPSFFNEVVNFFSTLELVDLGIMEKSALMEAGLLKKYGLTAPELMRLAGFYRQQKSRIDSAAVISLFENPGNWADELGRQLESVKKEIDKARSLPRRLKKKMKKIAGSRATHLLAGSMLIAANIFWQKEQQASVSIGIIFLNSALKAK